MSITIGSNIASLRAQRELSKNSHALSTVQERLSSGMRINHASDDAAGLSISSSLNSDARLFTQSVRNINDGISALSIASSAISTLSTIVTRISELAEQAANGVYSSNQRTALNDEGQALALEYNRIVSTTSFNDIQLLSQNSNHITVQAGINGSSASLITADYLNQIGKLAPNGEFTEIATDDFLVAMQVVTLSDVNGDGALDLIGGRTLGPAGIYMKLGHGDGTFGVRTQITNEVSGTIVFRDLDGDGDRDLLSGSSTTTLKVRLNNGSGTFGSATTFGDGGTMTFGDYNSDGKTDVAYVENASYLKMRFGNGDGTFAAEITLASDAMAGISTADFNNDGISDIIVGSVSTDKFLLYRGNGNGTFQTATDTSLTGNVISVQGADINGDGNLDVISRSGTRVELHLGNGDGTFLARTQITNNAGSTPQFRDFTGDGVLDYLMLNASDVPSVFRGSGSGTFTQIATFATADVLTSGDVNGDAVSDIIGVGSDHIIHTYIAGTQRVDGLTSFSLTTEAGARTALTTMQTELQHLSAAQGEIGATLSRLQGAQSIQAVMGEKYSEAESRILDADIAFESAELVRRTILQNTAAAVLAQANQAPSLVLTLLGNARR